jgi:hypothetical protein
LNVPTAEVPPSSPSAFAAKAEDLTGTLKWLVAAAGGIAAAIVAGLQLTAIADLQLGAALLAALGAAAALTAVGIFLLRATRVLAIQSPAVSELSNEELAAGVLEPLANLDDKALPPLIAWVRERRTSLLGDATSITSLYSDGVVGARRALDSLRRGEKSTWGNRALDPESAGDIAWLSAEYAAATARVERLEEAAGYWARREAYLKVIKEVPLLFVVFIIGVLIFAVTPVWGRSDATSEIKAPLPAQIYVQNADAAGVPSDCPATLSGQIVGGSLVNPIVVTVPTGSCPALKLTAQDDGLIVVPSGSSTPTSFGELNR